MIWRSSCCQEFSWKTPFTPFFGCSRTMVSTRFCSVLKENFQCSWECRLGKDISLHTAKLIEGFPSLQLFLPCCQQPGQCECSPISSLCSSISSCSPCELSWLLCPQRVGSASHRCRVNVFKEHHFIWERISASNSSQGLCADPRAWFIHKLASWEEAVEKHLCLQADRADTRGGCNSAPELELGSDFSALPLHKSPL